jgi:hypothetical protein
MMIIPYMKWKVIKFHGSKLPTIYCFHLKYDYVQLPVAKSSSMAWIPPFLGLISIEAGVKPMGFLPF